MASNVKRLVTSPTGYTNAGTGTPYAGRHKCPVSTSVEQAQGHESVCMDTRSHVRDTGQTFSVCPEAAEGPEAAGHVLKGLKADWAQRRREQE